MLSVATSDISFLSFLNNSFFVNTHLTVDALTKISQLDMLLIFSNSSIFSFKTLFLGFVSDMSLEFANVYLLESSMLSSNYQDVQSIMLLLSPELTLAFGDFFSLCYGEAKFNFVPSAVFDSYTNNLNYSASNANSYFMLFFFYV